MRLRGEGPRLLPLLWLKGDSSWPLASTAPLGSSCGSEAGISRDVKLLTDWRMRARGLPDWLPPPGLPRRLPPGRPTTCPRVGRQLPRLALCRLLGLQHDAGHAGKCGGKRGGGALAGALALGGVRGALAAAHIAVKLVVRNKGALQC